MSLGSLLNTQAPFQMNQTPMHPGMESLMTRMFQSWLASSIKNQRQPSTFGFPQMAFLEYLNGFQSAIALSSLASQAK